MAIETYMIEEAESLIADPEKTDEWNKIATELNLEGQLKQVSGEGKSPIPFQKLKVGEYRVYKTLCPNSTEVHKYSNSTIPLRVLSMIALAEREKYFDEIMIWDDLKSPDPIAIGIKGTSWSEDTTYIIARWGDELRSYVELRKIALDRIKESAKNKLSKILKTVDEDVEMFLNGEYVSDSQFFR